MKYHASPHVPVFLTVFLAPSPTLLGRQVHSCPPSKAGKQVIMPILQMGKWFVGTVVIKLTAASGGVLLGVRKTGVNCRSCLL